MKIVAAAVALLALAQDGQSARDALFARTVERLDSYLADYEPKLSALIADEVFHQELPPLTSTMVRPQVSRRLDSEVAFARLPGEAAWIGFRRVIKVDGKPVASSQESLAKLLSLDATDRLAQAQLLVIQSSEHNLGLPRTINMPNLPLELLQQKYRPRFDVTLGDAYRIRGHSVLELVFREKASPAIVAYGQRDDLLARLQVWTDISSGAVIRARVRFSARDAGDDPQIDVDFGEHRTLGLLVPTRMEERFPVQVSGAGKGRATYTNFRRFQTSGRIVPQ
jgi:hypothetical protein